MAKVKFTWLIPTSRDVDLENTSFQDTYQRTFDTKDLRDHLYENHHTGNAFYLMFPNRALLDLEMDIEEVLQHIEEAEAQDVQN